MLTAVAIIAVATHTRQTTLAREISLTSYGVDCEGGCSGVKHSVVSLCNVFQIVPFRNSITLWQRWEPSQRSALSLS